MQSSNGSKVHGSASNAVDGNRNSDYMRGSCTHTKVSDSPWWRVDVGNVVSVRCM